VIRVINVITGSNMLPKFQKTQISCPLCFIKNTMTRNSNKN